VDDQPAAQQLTAMNVHILHRIDLPARPAHGGHEHDHGNDHEHGEGPLALDPVSYAPPKPAPVPAHEMHPFLRAFGEEHVALLRELDAAEEAILSIGRDGYTRQADGKLRRFFDFLDQAFVPHNRREEAVLFPLLRERLIASGEHGKAGGSPTATDLMEDEHAKAMQLAAVVVGFLGLVFRLPDERSAMIVLDAALEQGKNLIELLRLHVFREDNIVFPLAHRLILAAELDALQARAAAPV
jgi:hemerythrin-like domain-containing protein